MTKLLSGKEVSESMLAKVLEDSKLLRQKGIIPTLAIFRIGDDAGSISYEKSIITRMAKSEIEVRSLVFDTSVTQEEFLGAIKSANADKTVNGILIFKPLPQQIDEEVIKYALSPEKDVDSMNPTNLGKLMIADEAGFFPCTAEGVVKILDYYDIDVKGMDVVIVNNSAVIGKPLSMLLTNRFATVTMCHVFTKDLMSYTKKADMVVTAVGKYGIITPEMLSEDTILIDCAMSQLKDDNGEFVLDEKGKKVRAGDAHISCKNKVKMITSATPSSGGGTGPVTTALLAEHIIKAAKLQNSVF